MLENLYFKTAWPLPGVISREVAALVVFGMVAIPAPAQHKEGDAINLSSAPLEQLMKIEVTSVARKQQSLSQTASAVYVITAKEIRRSGALDLPEVLRYVPGLQVRRIDAMTWAVSARGFNGEFSNKMLVMVDGRSVYTSLFGGVFWDTVNVELEDIERIEVIRGPGGTMWGANAMNGVLNIITRHAEATGPVFKASAGSGREARAYGGFSAPSGSAGAYRFSGSVRTSEPMIDAGGVLPDPRRTLGRLNFRLDRKLGASGDLMVSAGGLSSEASQAFKVPVPKAPYSSIESNDTASNGGHVLARYTHGEPNHSSSLQIFADGQHRTGDIVESQDANYDVEYQQRRVYGRHDVVMGGGARLSRTRLVSRLHGPRLGQTAGMTLLNVFGQDEIAIGERLSFTVGLKFEENSYAGAQLQPSFMLTWTPNRKTSFWTAMSRSVRTPTRVEREVEAPVNFAPNPFGTLFATTLSGDSNYGFEKMWAYETGLRRDISRRLSVDVATFYQAYKDLSILDSLPPRLDSSRNVLIPVQYRNGSRGESYGIEVSSLWVPSKRISVQGAYSWLHVDTRTTQPNVLELANVAEGRYAPQQGSVRLSYELPRRFEFDVSVLASARLEDPRLPEQFRSDARLGWRVTDAVELSVAGQNLFGPPYREFKPENYTRSLLSRRTVYASVSFGF